MVNTYDLRVAKQRIGSDNGAIPVVLDGILIGAARSWREERYWLRDVIRDMASGSRISVCGKANRGPAAIHVKGGRGYWANLWVCGALWLCPVCSANIRRRRAEHVSTAVATYLARGGLVLFGTFTVAHTRESKLSDLLAGLSEAFRALRQGARGQRARKSFGLQYTVRTVEVTYGRNGWHPHLHVLVLFRPETLPVVAGLLAGSWNVEWRRQLTSRGLTASAKRGVVWEQVLTSEGIGAYLVKVDGYGGIGAEMTRADLKIGRAGSLSPFDLARLFGATGDMAYRDLFRTYQAATAGVQAMRSSPGLWADLLPEADVADEDLAEQLVGGDAVLTLSDADFRIVVARRAQLRLLLAAEAGNDALNAALNALGISGQNPG